MAVACPWAYGGGKSVPHNLETGVHPRSGTNVRGVLRQQDSLHRWMRVSVAVGSPWWSKMTHVSACVRCRAIGQYSDNSVVSFSSMGERGSGGSLAWWPKSDWGVACYQCGLKQLSPAAVEHHGLRRSCCGAARQSCHPLTRSTTRRRDRRLDWALLLECSVGAFYGVDRFGSSAAGGAGAAFAGPFALGGTRTVLLQGYPSATAVSKDRY